jgi:small subunit ribosomal protein S17
MSSRLGKPCFDQVMSALQFEAVQISGTIKPHAAEEFHKLSSAMDNLDRTFSIPETKQIKKYMMNSTSAFVGTVVPLRAQTRVVRTRCVTQTRAAQALQGKVISTGSDKTTIVQVENVSIHPLYKKRVKRTKNYTAHDEKGECKVGDIVRLEPTRPLSKTKRFSVDSIVQESQI